MSAMRWVALFAYRQILPLTPILAIAPLGIVEPATKLRVDAVGRGLPHGNTVTYPAPWASVTVTFSAAAAASAGTPALPVTCISVTEPAAANPAPSPPPSTVDALGSVRVSNNRAGTNATYDAAEGLKVGGETGSRGGATGVTVLDGGVVGPAPTAFAARTSSW